MAETKTKVVIVGGGFDGWCVAATLSRLIGPLIHVVVVEPAQRHRHGLALGSLPTITGFHQKLGLEEAEFMRATDATIRFGSAFNQWTGNDTYFHVSGTFGRPIWLAPFHHVWLEASGKAFAGEFGDYSLEHSAFAAGKVPTVEHRSGYTYSYNLDVDLYADYLKALSLGWGVESMTGGVLGITIDAQTSQIAAVELASGQRVAADLFIDCTGQKRGLTKHLPEAVFQDWARLLLNDTALSVTVATTSDTSNVIPSCCEVTTHSDGWHSYTSLSGGVGFNMLYSSHTMGRGKATDHFKAAGAPVLLSDPVVKSLRPGRLRSVWNRNCIAFGYAACVVEPLEAVDIHLVQSGALRLVQMFPFGGSGASLAERYNRITSHEFDNARDFTLLHYALSDRADSGYWRAVQDLELPDTLGHRMELFKESGHTFQGPADIFSAESWVQVMLGQRYRPERWHPVGRLNSPERTKAVLQDMKASVRSVVAKTATIPSVEARG